VSSVLRVRVGCVGDWRENAKVRTRDMCERCVCVCLSVTLSVCVSERMRAPFDLGVHACGCVFITAVPITKLFARGGVGMFHGAEG